MNIRQDESSEELVLNLTSLVDVVFLLLIFFMVTTTFLDPERELDVELPSAQSAGETDRPPEEIVLNVLEDGTVVYLGEELTGPEALLVILRTAAQRDPETPVTIRGHRGTRHENIVSVMDACGSAGLRNLAVGTSTERRG